MKKENSKNKGQVMLLSALLIGGSILTATSIAGYLMLLQIRQSTNIANSARAISAASSGVDWALYQDKLEEPFDNGIVIDLNNGSRVKVSRDGDVITSIGNFGDSYRAFEINAAYADTKPLGE